MSRPLTERASANARGPRIAAVCVLVWLTAAISARWLGIWVAVGSTAVVLGLTVLRVDRAALTARLRPTARLVLLGATAGVVMAAATYLLYPLATRLLPFIATDTARLYAVFRAPSPAIAAVALVPIIVGEELVWRGAVQAALARRFGPWGGAALAATVYALVLIPLGSPVLVAAALCAGFAWAALRTASASLVPPIIAHLLWDALVLLSLPLQGG